MRTTRQTIATPGPDEVEHRCPGRIDGQACRWTYYVSRVQDDIDGHEQQRHADADAAFARHVDEWHPHAKVHPETARREVAS